jgi:hypothetical protein
MICVSLGILLLHTKVRDGASKGKVERHFHRQRMLRCPDAVHLCKSRYPLSAR